MVFHIELLENFIYALKNIRKSLGYYTIYIKVKKYKKKKILADFIGTSAIISKHYSHFT